MVRFISDFEWKELKELKTMVADFLTQTGEQTFSNEEAIRKMKKYQFLDQTRSMRLWL
jgi:hypothetical protein